MIQFPLRQLALGLIAFSWASTGALAAETQVFWPNPQAPSLTTIPKEPKAYNLETVGNTLKVNFSDIEKSDDYVFIDLGPVDLKSYREGGYLEASCENDNPILTLCFLLSEPEHFWDKKIDIEGGAILASGSHNYRYYLDTISPTAAANKANHLYLCLHDQGGAARGAANIKITSVTVKPPVAHWKAEKATTYAQQYRWPQVEPIDPLFYENFDNGVNWAETSSSPQLKRLSLDGKWLKKAFGERTWDNTFLADVSYAKPDYSATKWTEVNVPEAAAPDQPGSYFWYRKEFNLPNDFVQGRTFLRFDDLCDDARLYVNGAEIGTQASVRKQLGWCSEVGNRGMSGLPVKKAVVWRHFDRCQIESPFDDSAIPDGKNRLILPIFSGEYPWPLAYDVGRFLHPGKNVIAVRLYGNPVRGWWIFRHRDDRAAKNIYGLLGSVILAHQPKPGILSLTRDAATEVTADGKATHRFECVVTEGAGAKSVKFSCEGEEKTVPLAPETKSVSAEFSLPAQFATYKAQATLLGDHKAVLDARTLNFHGVVINIKGTELRLNGDPYLVRGINASDGVEFDNDRILTRKEFQRMLKLYQRLGFNSLRLSEADTWRADEAFRAGMMIMPVALAASCDYSINIFGQLVNPDLRLAADQQRAMSLLLHEIPNVLFWNDGNELHHTAGYTDKEVIENYLATMREAIRSQDPYHHPVIYANLDTWAENWFFLKDQDVVGWNIYLKAPDFVAQAPEVFAAAEGKPFVYTEWGTFKGKPDRETDIDGWEVDMRTKWALISKSPGVGGFLYGWHGELEDERGWNFLKELLLPYRLEKKPNAVVFTNRSEAPMREMKFSVTAEDNVVAAAKVKRLAPGKSLKIRLPDLKKGTLEIRYDTHHGLKHFFAEPL